MLQVVTTSSPTDSTLRCNNYELCHNKVDLMHFPLRSDAHVSRFYSSYIFGVSVRS